MTVAIRELCEETKGDITHKQARPLLAKKKFPIVPEPDAALNEDVEAITSKYEFSDASDTTQQKDLATKMGWTLPRTKAAMNEIVNRAAYKAETNNFNVVKHNWKTSGGATSVKPKGKGSAKAATAAATGAKVKKNVKPIVVVGRGRGRPRKVAAPVFTPNDEMQALTFVEANGGQVGVAQRIEALRAEAAAKEAEAADLATKLEMVSNLAKRLKAA
jgi:hypothetical protein